VVGIAVETPNFGLVHDQVVAVADPVDTGARDLDDFEGAEECLALSC
jgi:hypothetical protein